MNRLTKKELVIDGRIINTISSAIIDCDTALVTSDGLVKVIVELNRKMEILELEIELLKMKLSN